MMTVGSGDGDPSRDDPAKTPLDLGEMLLAYSQLRMRSFKLLEVDLDGRLLDGTSTRPPL